MMQTKTKSSVKDNRSNGEFFHKKGVNTNAPFIQPKLTVGPVDDVYEREADAVADKVMRMSNNTAAYVQPKISSVTIQRKCAACEDEEHIQRKEGGTNEEQEAPSVVADALAQGGSPLNNNTRSVMESRFGYDFSRVKIHTNTVATKSANAINALAYTSGNNIVFNEGQYSPGSTSGNKLIAHELTHVVQQGAASSAPVSVQRQHGHRHHTEPPAHTPTLGRCHPVQDDLRPTADWATLQARYSATCGSATDRAGAIAGGVWGDITSGRMPTLHGGAPGARDSVDCVCAYGSPRVVAIAAMARVIAAGPLAARMFWHFLDGSGTDEIIDVLDMVSRSAGVRAKIRRSMRGGGTVGTTRIEQSEYGIDDFQFAYGAIDCVQWRVAGTPAHGWRTNPRTPIEVSMLDYYEFHPARRAASQCAHAACVELVARGQARNFWTRGSAIVMLGQLNI